jgi:hypothetical protein
MILYIYIYTLMIISRSIPPRIRNVPGRICRGNQNTHFVFSNKSPRKSSNLLDNVEKISTVGQNTDKVDSCAFHVENLKIQTPTFGICNTLACLLQQWLMERAAIWL